MNNESRIILPSPLSTWKIFSEQVLNTLGLSTRLIFATINDLNIPSLIIIFFISIVISFFLFFFISCAFEAKKLCVLSFSRFTTLTKIYLYKFKDLL